MRESAPLAERIVAEARNWAGTPYRHQASVKGVGSAPSRRRRRPMPPRGPSRRREATIRCSRPRAATSFPSPGR